ncbi:MAG: hypothetical protein ACLVG5_01675 [Clostridium sp.]
MSKDHFEEKWRIMIFNRSVKHVAIRYQGAKIINTACLIQVGYYGGQKNGRILRKKFSFTSLLF